jgi:hypothetical protein
MILLGLPHRPSNLKKYYWSLQMLRLLIVLLCSCISALAKTPLRTPSPTSVIGSQLALGSSTTIIDAQLTGTAIWTMGGDKETSTIVLKARRDGKSRMDLQLSQGQWSEVRVNDLNNPHIFVSGGKGWKESAAHNGWNDANWFFPAFSAVATASDSTFTLASTGTNSLRAQFNVSSDKKPRTKQLIQILSITDFDLDPTTNLPVRMRWSTHPDDNYYVAIPYEVNYSDYRDVNGVKVPFQIKRYFNGTLELDITITAVNLNAGIPASDFSPKTN